MQITGRQVGREHKLERPVVTTRRNDHIALNIARVAVKGSDGVEIYNVRGEVDGARPRLAIDGVTFRFAPVRSRGSFELDAHTSNLQRHSYVEDECSANSLAWEVHCALQDHAERAQPHFVRSVPCRQWRALYEDVQLSLRRYRQPYVRRTVWRQRSWV